MHNDQMSPRWFSIANPLRLEDSFVINLKLGNGTTNCLSYTPIFLIYVKAKIVSSANMNRDILSTTQSQLVSYLGRLELYQYLLATYQISS